MSQILINWQNSIIFFFKQTIVTKNKRNQSKNSKLNTLSINISTRRSSNKILHKTVSWWLAHFEITLRHLQITHFGLFSVCTVYWTRSRVWESLVQFFIFYSTIIGIKSDPVTDLSITVSNDQVWISSIKMKFFDILFAIFAIFAAMELVTSYVHCPSVCRGPVGPDGCPSCTEHHTLPPPKSTDPWTNGTEHCSVCCFTRKIHINGDRISK